MRGRSIAAAIAAFVVVLVVLALASGFLVDWAWFASIDFSAVFWTTVWAKVGLFAAVWAVAAALLWLNGRVALRLCGPRRLRRAPPAVWGQPPQTFGELFEATPPQAWPLLVLLAALALGMLIALGESGHWEMLLRFHYQVPYGTVDPLFGKDIGFYLFSLPLYVALKNFLLLMLAAAAVMAGVVYLGHRDIEFGAQRLRVGPVVVAHGSALLGLYFVVKAFSYALDRYLLLYDDNGVVVGAGYADVHLMLPVLWTLIVASVAAALVAARNILLRTFRLPLLAVAALFAISFLFSELLPGLYERFYVKPSELQLETPYLRNNIALTREAYNLQHVTVQPFPVTEDLTAQSLQANRATIDNIRLWDWQPLMDTYAQLQEIRTYYRFRDVDIDRYDLGSDYQQVMLSAREIDTRLLAPNAQTWVNQHLLFTHGTGVVMSPVTRKTTEGLPDFYLHDIPTAVSGGPPVREQRIYFGEDFQPYVIVKGSTPEFDYPKGDDNVYASYDGADGVGVGEYVRRLLFAWYLDDPNILLSRYLTDQSRILIHRNIADRIETIAPFLRLDHDPYLVISEGRLYWIQDAYTTSEWFPYAAAKRDGENYIRNSVKIVVDAYNGTTSFYVADPGDPVIATWQRIFPTLFKPLAAMPADLQKHIRYPEDLFFIQAQVYRAYHMDAPEVFYNREDLWQFPREPTVLDGARNQSRMDPYYIMMRLPGEARAEFFLMLPMVPNQRENMIAWLAARCDPPNYGKLIVYQFPKDRLIYGPFQIEARINQNTEISQQLSLWNQMGSRVIRGNLLVIPIENSILYVSPLYLRAEAGQLPELKRVIAAYGDRVVMDDTLAGALAALFKGAPAPVGAAPAAAATGPAGQQAREALDHYNRAIARLKAGDWGGFGAEFDALKPLLEQMGR
jgi:uncharacterized membrane protein (UPF0182 family)